MSTTDLHLPAESDGVEPQPDTVVETDADDEPATRIAEHPGSSLSEAQEAVDHRSDEGPEPMPYQYNSDIEADGMYSIPKDQSRVASRPIGEDTEVSPRLEIELDATSDFINALSTDGLESHIDRHRHLLEDRDAHLRRIERSNEFARINNLVQLPTVKLRNNVVSLAQYQTGFKNQTGRGTCYAFAACAAIEAAYKRKYGLELDLSEQFAFHINKAGELYANYMTTPSPHENNSSFWGFQGSSDLIDKLARAAIPTEAAAPYLNDVAMEQLRVATPAAGTLAEGSSQEALDAFEFQERHIPTRARQSASYRVTNFAALPANPTPQQVEAVILSGREVVADVPGHCILIIGFDRTAQHYLVKNSWGEGRFITVPYASTTWPIRGGRYVIDVDARDARPQWDAFWVGRWQMDHDGWRGEMVIRRTTDYRKPQGSPTKLGSYYRDGKRRDVNGVTTQNGQGLRFWIADTTSKVQPGSPAGQQFEANVFSWDPGNAAGTTSWNGIPFGVSLSRGKLPGTPTQGFSANDWAGVWAMNHDGWRGTLRITSAQPLQATYTTSDGRVLAVSGSIGNHPHILRLEVHFSGEDRRPFQLFAHTWEKDVFSGRTQWGGLNFGVQGRRTGSANPFPHWLLVDNNSRSASIVADRTNLYQRHNNGWIFRYTGTPVSGWQALDNNSVTVELAASEGNLYQRHGNGRIFKYTGTPMTGWQALDDNSRTASIVADGQQLYQKHSNGWIFRYTGTPMTGWQPLDNNGATADIVAGGGNLYQRHSSGAIFKYTGTPMTGWQLVDNNRATVAIVADGADLYQRHSSGAIFKYTGIPITGWQLLDNNGATTEIAASGGQLYQRHSSGAIFKYTGPPMTGWRILDDNRATAAIAAGGSNLYQRHRTGAIFKSTA